MSKHNHQWEIIIGESRMISSARFEPITLYYIFYVLFAFVAPISDPTTTALPAVILFLAIYLLFRFGAESVSPYNGRPAVREAWFITRDSGVLYLAVLLLLSFLLSLYAINFYVGAGVSEMVASISSGQSMYSEYQNHFKESGASDFSMAKIPAILALFYSKLLFLTLCLRAFVLDVDCRRLKLAAVLAALPVLLFSLARGTSFELFELGFAVMFVIFAKKTIGQVVHGRVLLGTALVAVLMVMLYNYNINVRYGFSYYYSCSNSFCFDEDSYVATYAPGLADILFKMSAYFYFGIHYTSNLIGDVVSNPGMLFELFLPLNYLINEEFVPKRLCGSLLQCGPTWAPDIEVLLYRVGIFGCFIAIFCLGIFSKRLSPNSSSSVPGLIVLYYIYLYMISLPVGNFVFVSSANTLVLFASIGILIKNIISRKMSNES